MEITVAHLAMAAGAIIAVNQTLNLAVAAMERRFRAGRYVGAEAGELSSVTGRVGALERTRDEKVPQLDQVRAEVLAMARSVGGLTEDVRRLVRLHDDHLSEHKRSDALLVRIATKMQIAAEDGS